MVESLSGTSFGSILMLECLLEISLYTIQQWKRDKVRFLQGPGSLITIVYLTPSWGG